MRSLYEEDLARLAEEWQVFVADIAYGYDFERTVIDFTPGAPLASNSASAAVQADRGWQNSGLMLEAGKTYKLVASGQYEIVGGPKPWISEPNGVSIRYNSGRPLGVLLATVRPAKTDILNSSLNASEGGDRKSHSGGISPFLKPIVVGLGTTIAPTESGTLYFKINDSAGELSDNSGQAKVNITVE